MNAANNNVSPTSSSAVHRAALTVSQKLEPLIRGAVSRTERRVRHRLQQQMPMLERVPQRLLQPREERGSGSLRQRTRIPYVPRRRPAEGQTQRGPRPERHLDPTRGEARAEDRFHAILQAPPGVLSERGPARVHREQLVLRGGDIPPHPHALCLRGEVPFQGILQRARKQRPIRDRHALQAVELALMAVRLFVVQVDDGAELEDCIPERL